MNKLEIQLIEKKIHFVRGHRVMLDADLAELYGVETKTLKRAVNRNIDRFPDDFMFELKQDELDSLRNQSGTSKKAGRGGQRYLPYVFTQEGVAMLSAVLSSKKAIQVNIAIMRTFVKVRELLEANKDLAAKIAQLEKKYDGQFQVVFEVLDQLLAVGSPVTQKKIRTISEK